MIVFRIALYKGLHSPDSRLAAPSDKFEKVLIKDTLTVIGILVL